LIMISKRPSVGGGGGRTCGVSAQKKNKQMEQAQMPRLKNYYGARIWTLETLR